MGNNEVIVSGLGFDFYEMVDFMPFDYKGTLDDVVVESEAQEADDSDHLNINAVVTKQTYHNSKEK